MLLDIAGPRCLPLWYMEIPSSMDPKLTEFKDSKPGLALSCSPSSREVQAESVAASLRLSTGKGLSQELLAHCTHATELKPTPKGERENFKSC